MIDKDVIFIRTYLKYILESLSDSTPREGMTLNCAVEQSLAKYEVKPFVNSNS